MRFLFATALCIILQTSTAWSQKFQQDDPLKVDDDATIDTKSVAPHKLSDYYDFLEHTFSKRADRSHIRAVNINTIGEVPDSSWFTNRASHELMKMGDGPSFEDTWQVVEGKSDGVTPGFRIRDSRGDVYFIKFDPITNPEMTTAAEMISTHFFNAIGYNVPENHIVLFNRDQLVMGSKAKIRDAAGKERQMTVKDLDQILARVSQVAGGKYRAVASKFLAGKSVGPFEYYGTRADDPNDVFPHEHRRELRGLAVFAAWLNHDDSRAINTLDMLVKEDDRQHVKHYLIDFGSTLGSGSTNAQKPRAGNEYYWEFKPAVMRIATLGLWDRPWIRAEYPNLPSVGAFESSVFDPKNWKPEYPNPAFMNLQPEDAYWAAKIVMSFSDYDIRKIVRTGLLSDEQAEQYVVDTLIQRRDKIGRYWLSRMLSLDNFRINGSVLQFQDLLAEYGLGKTLETVTAKWYRFDNDAQQKTALLTAGQYGTNQIPLPADVLASAGSTDQFFVVEIADRISVFVRNNRTLEIVGIERN